MKTEGFFSSASQNFSHLDHKLFLRDKRQKNLGIYSAEWLLLTILDRVEVSRYISYLPVLT